VVEELRVPRDPRYNPVFQVNFRAQTEEPWTLPLAGVHAEPLPFDIGFSRFDLALDLRYDAGRVGGYIEYDVDLFEEATVDGLATELGNTLEQLVDRPDRPILEVSVQQPWQRSAGPSKSGIPRLPVRRAG
jgi:non-ribosomal peptide synthetase component F